MQWNWFLALLLHTVSSPLGRILMPGDEATAPPSLFLISGKHDAGDPQIVGKALANNYK